MFSENPIVYLDYAAGAPVLPGVIEEYHDTLTRGSFNPSAAHRRSRKLREELDEIERIARVCQLEEMTRYHGTVLVHRGGQA